jgi:quinol monooxygenase YgiN
MTIRIEEQAKFMALFESHRSAISEMPGCEDLQILSDACNSGIFFTLSQWKSQEYLDQYRNSEIFKTLWPQVKNLFHAPAEAWSVNPIKPQD